MMETGHGGRIVHLSSVRAVHGAWQGFDVYGASKAGIDFLVRQLATEWREPRITVKAVAPGFAKTAMAANAALDQGFMRGVIHRTPLGRIAETRKVADAVLHLVSPRASFVTEQILYVHGGVSAS